VITDNPDTAITRHRYDRIASVYDVVESMMELRARAWRRELWALVAPGRVLELGVGTGKNVSFYPRDREIVAADISDRMLKRARTRAERHHARVRLELADAQSLPFGDGSFDVVVATFVFCSVPDALLGLQEARRVLAAGGQLLLLEHVLSERPAAARLMHWLDPISYHLWGAHIDQ
jgi:ubiquinone/menaquinone biosynthesis C-methylase UbiE